MNNEEYEKFREEMARIIQGDGELRLWRVGFKITNFHGDDGTLLTGLEGVAEVHEAYIRVMMQMGALAAAWTLVGFPHVHTWWIWADGREEAERLVRASPAGNFGKIYRIEVEYPFQPVRISPAFEKALRPPIRHSMIRRILREGLSHDEIFEHIDDEHLDDAEHFLLLYIFWGWQASLRRKNPELDEGLKKENMECWPVLVSLAAAMNKEERAVGALKQAERQRRNTEGRLAELGVDVAEMRRRADEYAARGEQLPPDFWYDMPMKYPVDFQFEPSPDDEDSLGELE